MRRVFVIVGTLLAVVVVGGWLMRPNSARKSFTEIDAALDTSSAVAPAMPAEEPAAGMVDMDKGGGGESEQQNRYMAQNVPQKRLVIKAAVVEAEAPYEQLASVVARIEQLVERSGGFIVSTDDSTSLASSSAYVAISFRVPAGQFTQVLNDLDGEHLEIIRRDISGEDVTDEYVDNQSRLRNLEATAARLRDLLEQAENVEEAIEVTNTLSEYETEIEIIKGRQQYLEESAAMSSITLTVRSQYVAPVAEANPGWSPAITAQRAWVELKELGQGIVDFLIVAAIWSPVWLTLLGLALLGWRFGRRIWVRLGLPGPIAASTPDKQP